MLRFYTEGRSKRLEESDLEPIYRALAEGKLEDALSLGYWTWDYVVGQDVETTPSQRKFLETIYIFSKKLVIDNALKSACRYIDEGETYCARTCLNNAKEAAREVATSEYLKHKVEFRIDKRVAEIEKELEKREK